MEFAALSPPLPQIPPDELTAAILDAAFSEVEEIASERGLDAEDFTSALLARTIDRYWTGQDRNALRAKVCGAVSSFIDGWFDAMGDATRNAP